MTDRGQMREASGTVSKPEAQTQEEGAAILTALLNRAQERSRQRKAPAEASRVGENARALYNRD